jgi:SAM-dependent methyltransferase
VAADQEAWTPELAANLGAMFDQLAIEWHTRATTPGRYLPLLDALDRGGPFTHRLAVEVGSGTGLATETIADRVANLIAIDLSIEMLRIAPPLVPRVRADASALPLRDASVATMVLVNMLLFPIEIDRVLTGDGALVWVNTIGERTPIHLTADEIDGALPGEWDIAASEAGWGTWCVARREPGSPRATRLLG